MRQSDEYQPHVPLSPDEHPWRAAGYRPGSWQDRRLGKRSAGGTGGGPPLLRDAGVRERMAEVLLRGDGGHHSEFPNGNPNRIPSMGVGAPGGVGRAPNLAGIPEAVSGLVENHNPDARPRAPPIDPEGTARDPAAGEAGRSATVRISVRANPGGTSRESRAGSSVDSTSDEGMEPPPDSGERPPDAKAGGAVGATVLIGTDSGDIDFGAEAARGIVVSSQPTRYGGEPGAGGSGVLGAGNDPSGKGSGLGHDGGGAMALPTADPAVATLAEKSAAAVGDGETLTNPQTLPNVHSAARPLAKAVETLVMHPADPDNPDGVWEVVGNHKTEVEGDVRAERAAIAAAEENDKLRLAAANAEIQAMLSKKVREHGPPANTVPPDSDLRRRFGAWKVRMQRPQ